MGNNNFIRLFIIMVIVAFGFCLMGSSCAEIKGTMPPKGKIMETGGGEVTPPQGYIDYQKRINDTEL